MVGGITVTPALQITAENFEVEMAPFLKYGDS